MEVKNLEDFEASKENPKKGPDSALICSVDENFFQLQLNCLGLDVSIVGHHHGKCIFLCGVAKKTVRKFVAKKI